MKTRRIITNFLLALSLIQLFLLFYYIITSERAYVIANFPHQIENVMLIYFPIFLTIVPISIFIFDLISKKQKNWLMLLIALISNFSSTVFVIGTLLFANH